MLRCVRLLGREKSYHLLLLAEDIEDAGGLYTAVSLWMLILRTSVTRSPPTWMPSGTNQDILINACLVGVVHK